MMNWLLALSIALFAFENANSAAIGGSNPGGSGSGTDETKVAKAGDTMTGTLIMLDPAQLSVGTDLYGSERLTINGDVAFSSGVATNRIISAPVVFVGAGTNTKLIGGDGQENAIISGNGGGATVKGGDGQQQHVGGPGMGADGGTANLTGGAGGNGNGGAAIVSGGNGTFGNAASAGGPVKLIGGNGDIDAGGSVYALPGSGGLASGNIFLGYDGSTTRGRTAIGGATSLNPVDIYGAVAIGSPFAGIKSAPTNGLIVGSGFVGINVSTPNAQLAVKGNIDLVEGPSARVIQVSSRSATGNDLSIRAGSSSGGNGGNLDLTSGNNNTATSGNVRIFPANSSTTDGNVLIGYDGSTAIGNVCIGCTGPVSKLDVEGSASVGATYAGSIAAPANGLIIEGNTGIGNSSPATRLDVTGAAQFGQSVRKSTFTNSADLVMASGSSVTLRGANGFLIGASSFTTTGGIFGASGNFTGPVTVSSAVFTGLTTSTAAAGGAGVLVTALCPVGTLIKGGGCECTGGVALTGNLNRPNCVTAGCIPNGWSCQEPGGTGGTCSAYAVCNRTQ